MSPKPVHTSSARKAGRRPGMPYNPVLVAIVVLIAAAILAILLSSPPAEEAPPAAPSPSPQPSAPRAISTPPAAAMPESFAADPFAATPAATPTMEPVTDNSVTTDDACIAFHWTAGLQPGKELATEVQVTVSNNCDRDLSSLTLSFEARGYREGQQVEAAQGNMGGALAAGETRQLLVTLPAVPGGYDRIDLQAVE